MCGRFQVLTTFRLFPRKSGAVRINDGVARDRPDVFPREVITRIPVVHHPVTTVGVTNENHYVMIPHGSHSRSRFGTWKITYPIGSKIELRTNLAEDIARCLAAAKFMRASGGPTTNDNVVSVGINMPAGRRAQFSMVRTRMYRAISTAAHVAGDLCVTESIVSLVPALCMRRRNKAACKGYDD